MISGPSLRQGGSWQPEYSVFQVTGMTVSVPAGPDPAGRIGCQLSVRRTRIEGATEKCRLVNLYGASELLLLSYHHHDDDDLSSPSSSPMRLLVSTGTILLLLLRVKQNSGCADKRRKLHPHLVHLRQAVESSLVEHRGSVDIAENTIG